MARAHSQEVKRGNELQKQLAAASRKDADHEENLDLEAAKREHAAEREKWASGPHGASTFRGGEARQRPREAARARDESQGRRRRGARRGQEETLRRQRRGEEDGGEVQRPGEQAPIGAQGTGGGDAASVKRRGPASGRGDRARPRCRGRRSGRARGARRRRRRRAHRRRRAPISIRSSPRWWPRERRRTRHRSGWSGCTESTWSASRFTRIASRGWSKRGTRRRRMGCSRTRCSRSWRTFDSRRFGRRGGYSRRRRRRNLRDVRNLRLRHVDDVSDLPHPVVPPTALITPPPPRPARALLPQAEPPGRPPGSSPARTPPPPPAPRLRPSPSPPPPYATAHATHSVTSNAPATSAKSPRRRPFATQSHASGPARHRAVAHRRCVGASATAALRGGGQDGVQRAGPGVRHPGDDVQPAHEAPELKPSGLEGRTRSCRTWRAPVVSFVYPARHRGTRSPPRWTPRPQRWRRCRIVSRIRPPRGW